MNPPYYTLLPPLDNTLPIRGGAGELCYLVMGEKACALIDTGCGGGELRTLVEGFTSLPVQVLLTHGHRDHVGGLWEWAQAWLHPGDEPLLKTALDPARRAAFVRGKAPNFFAHLSPDSFPPCEQVDIRPLHPGQEFDLGGTVLQVVHTPGHTPGSVSFLDKAHRRIFTGDICTRRTLMMLPESQPLSVLAQTLRLLQALRPHYDLQLIGHDPMVPGEGVVENLMVCIGDILQGRDDHVPFANVSGVGFLSKTTRDAEQQFPADGTYGNIVYKVYKNDFRATPQSTGEENPQ